MDLLAAVRTGDYLEAVEFPPLTVGELLESSDCTPMCITASGPDAACVCPCNGYYHGRAWSLVIPGCDDGA